MEVHAVDECAVNVEDHRLEHHAPQYSKTPAMTLNAAVAASTGHASITVSMGVLAVGSGPCMLLQRATLRCGSLAKKIKSAFLTDR